MIEVLKRVILMIAMFVFLAVAISAALNALYYIEMKKTDNLYMYSKKQTSTTTKIMSYNIRCWNVMDYGRKNWFLRAGAIMQTLLNFRPHIVGFQEVTSIQYKYLKDHFIGYDSTICYRDHSPFSEGCPIFFNANQYTLLKKNTFWLSNTPQIMSKDWGASNYRVCTYVVLKDKATNVTFAVLNTHLDDRSDTARQNSLELIKKCQESLKIPTILIGDFNFDDQSLTYKYITQYFNDTKQLAEKSINDVTYHNWGKKTSGSPIDYVFTKFDKIHTLSYYIDKNTYNDVFPSDHYPICVELDLQEYE